MKVKWDNLFVLSFLIIISFIFTLAWYAFFLDQKASAKCALSNFNNQPAGGYSNLTYENSEYGIFMQYSGIWRPILNINAHKLNFGGVHNLNPVISLALQSICNVDISLKEKSLNYKLPITFLVAVRDLSFAKNMTFDQYSHMFIKELLGRNHTITIGYLLNTTVSQREQQNTNNQSAKIMPAHLMTIYDNRTNALKKDMIIWTIMDGIIYHFIYTADPDTYFTYLPDVQKIVDSIVIDKNRVQQKNMIYENPANGFKLQYPVDWIPLQGIPNGIIEFDAPLFSSGIIKTRTDV